MTTQAQTTHLRKTMPALIAALGMTALIGVIILALSMNVLLNHNTVPIKSTASDPPAAAGQSTVQQLQAMIQQYQSRESQYQTQLQQAADQISSLTQQNQQYQNLISALQQAGIIRIGSDGNVYLGGGIGDTR
jgi:hypothetical protein